MSARQSYAFVGLGHLGGQLAANLIHNGFAVTVRASSGLGEQFAHAHALLDLIPALAVESEAR